MTGIELLSVVALLEDLPESGSVRGQVGTVVESQTPPRSGWLDELGRLKGGWAKSLGVARCAPY